MRCIQGYDVQPLRSPAGYYMGTIDTDGCPNCRISQDYAKTFKEAKELPLNRQLSCYENSICNNGRGCFAQL